MIWVFKALGDVVMNDVVKKIIVSVIAFSALSFMNYLNVKLHVDNHADTSMQAVRQVIEGVIFNQLGVQP